MNQPCLSVATAGDDGHWDHADIKRLCEYRDRLKAALTEIKHLISNYGPAEEDLLYAIDQVLLKCSAAPKIKGESDGTRDEARALANWLNDRAAGYPLVKSLVDNPQF